MSDYLIVGCGYLGRRLGDRLLAEGNRVHVTTRSVAKADTFRAAGFLPVVCDVTDTSSLGSLPAVGTVVHAVGLDRAVGKPMREVYVEGLANVLTHLPTPRRFIHVSSTSVYGQSGGEIVDETSPTEPVEKSGKIVLEAEQILHTHLPTGIILRFAGIYGSGRLIRAQALQSAQPIPTDPEKWLNLVHVEDGVSAILAASERGHDGSLYVVCDDVPVRRRDYYTCLAEVLHAPPPTFVPGPPEMANRRLSNRRLREELGFIPRYPDYRSGLTASCRA